MTSGTGDLVRRLETTTRATFLELFFDVAFVFALRALAQLLFSKLTWSGAYHALVLSAAVPEAFGKTGLVFAGTYLAVQIGRNLWVAILLRHQDERHVPQRS